MSSQDTPELRAFEASEAGNVCMRSVVTELTTILNKAGTLLGTMDEISPQSVSREIKDRLADIVAFAALCKNIIQTSDAQCDTQRIETLLRIKGTLHRLEPEPECYPRLSSQQKELLLESSEFVTKSILDNEYQLASKHEQKMKGVIAGLRALLVDMEKTRAGSSVDTGMIFDPFT